MAVEKYLLVSFIEPGVRELLRVYHRICKIRCVLTGHQFR